MAEALEKDYTKDQLLEVNAALSSGMFVHVRRMLQHMVPCDIALLLESSPPKGRKILWQLVDMEVYGDVLEELSEEITKNDIEELLTWYPHKSTLQRLGFLLEELQVEEILLEPIIKHLKKSKYFPVLLSPKSKQKAGAVNNNWKVDINSKLESDL